MIRNGARPGATCNPQNCTFRLQIMTQLPRIPLLGRKAIFLYTTLPYIGVRSWIVYAQLDVRDGKLDKSGAGVWEYRMERVDYNAYRQLIPLGYGVVTQRDAASFTYVPSSSQEYQVWVSHGVFKIPSYALDTCVVQSATAPMKRAFDVHLSCLNNPFRNCRFDELAPSAGLTIPRRTTAKALVTRTGNLTRLARTGWLRRWLANGGWADEITVSTPFL